MSLFPKTLRSLVALCLLALSHVAIAAALTPGMPYYFESFDPIQRPWEPGEGLNIEEVFKNYQFYEIVPDSDGKEITVHHYIQSRKAGSEQYRVMPDRSLQKK